MADYNDKEFDFVLDEEEDFRVENYINPWIDSVVNKIKEKKPKCVIITHGNFFHADDVLSTVLRILYYGMANILIVRLSAGVELSILENIIKTSCVGINIEILDVGGVDDGEGKVDHHHRGFDKKRPNGIPYATFGLVWERFGMDILKKMKITNFIDDVFNAFDNRIASIHDAADNGYIIKKMPRDAMKLNQVVSCFNPIFAEREDFDKRFMQAVRTSVTILKRFIMKIYEDVTIENKIKDIIEQSGDKKYFVLDSSYFAAKWLAVGSGKIFIIFPRGPGSWRVCTILSDDETLTEDNKRKFVYLFPKEWGGLSAVELQKETGVSDVTFCHTGLSIMGAKSFEGCLQIIEASLKKNPYWEQLSFDF